MEFLYLKRLLVQKVLLTGEGIISLAQYVLTKIPYQGPGYSHILYKALNLESIPLDLALFRYICWCIWVCVCIFYKLHLGLKIRQFLVGCLWLFLLVHQLYSCQKAIFAWNLISAIKIEILSCLINVENSPTFLPLCSVRTE